eukprot:1157398-Pelagomonas_calceolata.AAC.8
MKKTLKLRPNHAQAGHPDLTPVSALTRPPNCGSPKTEATYPPGRHCSHLSEALQARQEAIMTSPVEYPAVEAILPQGRPCSHLSDGLHWLEEPS